MSRWTHAGTVISGTLRLSDRISAMWDTLTELTDPIGDDIDREVVAVCGTDPDRVDYGDLAEEAQWTFDHLFDQLSALAPVGYVFGGHAGDPADLGFWFVADEEESDVSAD